MLSGKILCGECGSKYAGNSRKPRTHKPLYISYNCTKRNGKESCHNPGIKRDVLEKAVLGRLADAVFDEKLLPDIVAKYNDFAKEKDQELFAAKTQVERRIAETNNGINNIVNLVVQTGSSAPADKLKELEAEKVQLEASLLDIETQLEKMTVLEEALRAAFKEAKRMLQSGTLVNRKAIVDRYVKVVIIYPDTITVEFNISGTYTLVIKPSDDRRALFFRRNIDISVFVPAGVFLLVLIFFHHRFLGAHREFDRYLRC